MEDTRIANRHTPSASIQDVIKDRLYLVCTLFPRLGAKLFESTLAHGFSPHGIHVSVAKLTENYTTMHNLTSPLRADSDMPPLQTLSVD